MKKLLALFLSMCLIICSAGCSGSPDASGMPPAADGNLYSPTATVEDVIISPSEPFVPADLEHPMHAVVMPTVSKSIQAEDGRVIFTTSHQQIQLILHGTDVEDDIACDLQLRMSSLLSDSSDTMASAYSDYDGSEEWIPYFTDVTYVPTRIDQSVLSLFANYSSYSGGQHPTLLTESVTYDLTTGQALTLGDILVEDFSGSDLSALIAASLSPQSSELYHDYVDVLKDRFSGSYSGITSWYFSRSGLCFHFSPYDIAPYSSGTIIAEIPYEYLESVLKEQYLPAAKIDAPGSIYGELYLEDDEERFSYTANVVLNDDGTKILLYPDANVTDVRIEIGTHSSENARYIPTTTVFAADCVGLGNAIAVTADFSQDAPVLRLIYRSGEQEVSAFIMYDTAGDSVILAHG